MAIEMMSDELLATVMPAVVFWVAAGVYELLAYLLPDSWLNTEEEEEEKNYVSRWAVAKNVLLQQALQISIFLLLMKMFGSGDQNQKPEQPSLLVGAWQFVKAMAVLDAHQYWMHRALHSKPWIYRLAHSTHHNLVVPFSFGSIHSHPIDAHLYDTLGALLAVHLAGMTARTSMYFFCFATVRGIDIHSNLWLPWSPFQMLFDNNAAFHEVHHQLGGRHCNFATPFFSSWDKMMGTYVPYTVEKREGGGYRVRAASTFKAE